MQSFLDVLASSSGVLLNGLMITIAVSAIAVATGIALGAVFGLALTYGGAVVSFPARMVVDIVRGTPVLVLILACFYMPAGIGLSPGPLTAGAFALPISARRSGEHSWQYPRRRPMRRARSA
jgi:polar amino acid transport system permease protein